MRYAWMLFLISPVFLSGCVLFPNMEPHKQTVQKGSPPQVNPDLPGGKKATEFPKSATNPTNPGQTQFPPASTNYTPITPEQVNENNAHQIVEQMQNQIGGSGMNQGTPGMSYNHSTKDSWPK